MIIDCFEPWSLDPEIDLTALVLRTLQVRSSGSIVIDVARRTYYALRPMRGFSFYSALRNRWSLDPALERLSFPLDPVTRREFTHFEGEWTLLHVDRLTHAVFTPAPGTGREPPPYPTY